MKTKLLPLVLIALIMPSVSTRTYAYDIAVENEDGVKIYYNYINDSTSLEVTHGEFIYEHYSGSLIIPEEVIIESIPYKVTRIGYAAFRDCDKLISVDMPHTVMNIEAWAFRFCSSIDSLIIPSSVLSIGYDAFDACYNLRKIVIEDGEKPLEFQNRLLEEYTFEQCPLDSVYLGRDLIYSGRSPFFANSLRNLIIGRFVTTINSACFINCQELERIEIPSSVTLIKDMAFMNCTGLKVIHFDDGLLPLTFDFKGVWSHFYYCTIDSLYLGRNIHISLKRRKPFEGASISSVNISKSVNVIPELLFAFNNLEHLYISENVEMIMEYAFCGASLTDVFCYATNVPITAIDVFNDTPINNSTLHVPASAIDAYRTTEPWSKFGKIVTLDEDVVPGVKAIPVLMQFEGSSLMVSGAKEGTPISIYDLSGHLLGSATATNGTTRVQAPNNEKVVIVKVGERTVKVAK